MSLSIVKHVVRKQLPRPLFEALQSLRYWGRRVPGYDIYQAALTNKQGIEIGGPSELFKTTLPIYPVIGSLDGVNFAAQTVWEGSIRSGRTFNYVGDKKGEQFVCEATDLHGIESETYDFLLSSNCLEHVANPLKAIREWRRVIKDGGLLVLVLPNKQSNFDHRRPITTFEHLLDDYEREMTEHDLTHIEEILALHDLAMDPAAGTLEQFRLRSLDNFNNRTLHHHVFDVPLIEAVLRYFGFAIIKTDATATDFFALASKA